MKIKISLLVPITLLLLCSKLYAQVGIGTDTPAASAALEVASSSNNKGILIPRITASQKDAINNPAEGLMIYQTSAPAGFYYYMGSAWKLIMTQTDLDTKLSTVDATTSLNTKVDKVTGKDLSSNDYTAAEKTKLSNLSGTNTGDQDLSALATIASVALKANTTDVNTSLATKVDKITGKDLSSNDYTTTEKTKLAAISGNNTGDQDLSSLATTASVALKANTADVNTSLASKVDKVTGKQLSSNDYTTVEKTKVSNLSGTNTGDQDLSALATTASVALKANTTDVITSLASKVDKVTGKELSSNDYTTTEKTKLAAISGNNTGDQDLSALATTASVALKANTTDVSTNLALKVDKVTGKALSSNDYTTVEKTKLAAITGTNTGDQTNITGNAATATLAQRATLAGNIDATSNSTLEVLPNLTTLGTITSGTWEGDLIAINAGGTGASSVARARENLGLVIGVDVQGVLTPGNDYLTPAGNAATATLAERATLANNIDAISNSTLEVLPNLTTLGTITSGTWRGSPIAIEKGGTGSITLNFVDLSSNQTIAGAKSFSSDAEINDLTIGRGAGNVSSNTVLGRGALQSNTDGGENVAFGNSALTSNTSGSKNIAIGSTTLANNTTGNSNTANGNQVMVSNTTGSANTASGELASYSNRTGSNNVAIGYRALFSNTTGTDNTALGANASVGLDNLTNATAIGAGARVDANNTIQLGNALVRSVVTSGKIKADGFITTTGTPDEFLKANGSVDGNTYVNKDAETIGIGANAGLGQGTASIAIGTSAGKTTQGVNSIALGAFAGNETQGANSIAIGKSAGELAQGVSSIAIGDEAGSENQGLNSIAIGTGAGKDTQGTNSIAIGELAGHTNQASNSIILNATSSGLTAPTTGFFVAPIQSATTSNALYYNTLNKEISYGAVAAAAAGTLTGTTLASAVVSSSLTSVGTLASATVSGKVIVGASSETSTSAVLEASSTTQGFLPPRMTEAQRDAISAPVAGLVVWCRNCGSGELQVHNGIAWKNMIGATAAAPYTIGQAALGGKIAYILQPGDRGYDANVPHGLVATTADISTGAQWGCAGSLFSGAVGITAIGTGAANTAAIMAGCTTPGIAAELCGNLVEQGYSDWYLPSNDELNKLYINRALIGGFDNNRSYWSSTDAEQNAWYLYFGDGKLYYGPKNNLLPVRAIRAF